MKSSIHTGILLAILAAALYALNPPFSKLLPGFMPPTLMAGVLYLGAGLGMSVVGLFRRTKQGGENNCTRRLSSKDPLQIVVIKGIFSGFGLVLIGLVLGERFSVLWSVFGVLAVGFVAYGMSIFF